jgi:hypothetical protein
MAVTETEFEKYACMIDEMQAAKSLAAEGDINRAMISAQKSRVLYQSLKQSGAIETIIEESFVIEQVPEGFTKAIAAQAYLTASETALKEGNVRKAQMSYWMILPGTELRQYLDSENNGLAKRAKTMDHLLCIVNRKYFI